MAKKHIDDYFYDSGWDGNYFYIEASNFESFPQGSNDIRAFMRALLSRVNDVNDNLVASDKSTKMVLGRSVSISQNNLTETYSTKFSANIDTNSNTYDVIREPFKVVIESMSDNADGTANINIAPISAGDRNDDYIMAIGYVASKTVRTPTYDTDYDVDVGNNWGGFSSFTTSINNNFIAGTYYVTPWMYAYDHVLDQDLYYYGPTKTIKITNTLCLVEGTKITLADGSEKNIESLTYNDDLLVWNFDEGKLDSAKPVWLSVNQPANRYSKVTFSDGSVLNSLSPALGHSIYSVESGAFVSPMSYSVPTGTVTVKYDGSNTNIVSKELVNSSGDLNFYGVLTNTHMNCYANGILTSYNMNNLYPISGMQYVKTNRSVRDVRDFPPQASGELFTGLRLAEQRRSDESLNAILKRMIRDQKPN